MDRKGKYEYLLVIQRREPGFSWEDVCEYSANTDRRSMLADLREYRASEGVYGRYRYISRRVERVVAINTEGV